MGRDQKGEGQVTVQKERSRTLDGTEQGGDISWAHSPLPPPLWRHRSFQWKTSEGAEHIAAKSVCTGMCTVTLVSKLSGDLVSDGQYREMGRGQKLMKGLL